MGLLIPGKGDAPALLDPAVVLAPHDDRHVFDKLSHLLVGQFPFVALVLVRSGPLAFMRTSQLAIAYDNTVFVLARVCQALILMARVHGLAVTEVMGSPRVHRHPPRRPCP